MKFYERWYTQLILGFVLVCIVPFVVVGILGFLLFSLLRIPLLYFFTRRKKVSEQKAEDKKDSLKGEIGSLIGEFFKKETTKN